MSETRPVASGFQEGDEGELSLRPRLLREFIGQPRLKDNLQIAIEGATGRGEPLDHILFYGPPGLGKTTLSFVCGHEMNVQVRTTSGPAIERPGDLAAILTNQERGSILFIDEIHRLNRTVEEILYPAMEDFTLDLVIGKGPSARTMRLPLPAFTLIGATTQAGLVSSPLRDRFGQHYYFDFYTVDDLLTIVKRSADILKIEVSGEGALEIARRARGTPRIANRLLRRCRDYAQVRADGVITPAVADATMGMLEIDPLGLDDFDRRYLRSIIEKHDGGPVGVETLAAALGEERNNIEDVYEPFLLKLGFLNRTPRGRVATRLAYEHLGLTFPEKPDPTGGQGRLL
jgi:holliday junction DNA helicase RuvB